MNDLICVIGDNYQSHKPSVSFGTYFLVSTEHKLWKPNIYVQLKNLWIGIIIQYTYYYTNKKAEDSLFKIGHSKYLDGRPT